MRNASVLALLVIGSVGCERAEPEVAVAPPPTRTAEAPAPAPAPAVSPVVAPKPKPVVPDLATVEPPPLHDAMMWPGGPPQRPLAEARAWFAKLTGDQKKGVRSACMAYRKDPCMGALRPFSDSYPDPANPVLVQIGTAQRGDLYEYCAHVNRGQPVCDTPLVVSFDDAPVEFEAATGEFAFEPGAPVATRWPSAATPWIAIDLDGDGAITSGRELFGDATQIAGGTARNGFDALAALDANHDGVIDARDPAFAKLLLWTDRDGDRRSTPTELAPLSLRIASLSLANHRDVRCTDGDCEGERGSAVQANGSRATVVDVYLRGR